jgi:glycosyltransferase involved in cell wall biosynthesis
VNTTASIAAADRPQIGIALPTFNRPRETARALRSALTQTYPAHEIIISDDCLDDTIKAVIDAQPDPRVRYLANRPPLGMPAKLNDVLARATSDWLIFLGDDDIFDRELLARMAEAICADPQVVMVHARTRMVTEDGQLVAEDRVPDALVSPSDFVNRLFQPWYQMRVSITGFCFPVALLRQLGGFRAHCSGGLYSDTLAWTSIALHGKTRLIGQPLITMSEVRSQEAVRSRVMDGREVLASRLAVSSGLERDIQSAIQNLSDPAECRRLLLARKRALNFIAKETRIAIRRALTALLLLKTKEDRWDSVKGLIKEALASSQPFVWTLWFHLQLTIFCVIADWPRPIRVLMVRLTNAIVSIAGRIERRGRTLGPVS